MNKSTGDIYEVFRLVQKKEILYCIPCLKTRMDSQSMGHINFWSTLVLTYHTQTTRKKNGKALLVDRQDNGPQINAKKIGLNIIQSKYHNIKIVNKSVKIR
jgi:hypothetical protein